MWYGKTYIEFAAYADSSIHPIKPRQLPKDNGVRSIIALNVLERAFQGMVRTASGWPIGRLTAGREIVYSVEVAAGSTFVPLARLMCATVEIDGYSVKNYIHK